MDETAQTTPRLPTLSTSRLRAASLEWLAIALGGAIGACLRHGIERAFAAGLRDSIGSLVISTLLVNLVGAALLGRLLGELSKREGSPLLRPFLVFGLLGSFTTYSGLVFQSDRLASDLDPEIAGLYFIGSLLTGLLAFLAGEASSGAGE